MATVLRRRDRLRAATVAEIKESARQYLTEEGPAGISLRTIARDMGMSAPAVYRYFPSTDTLLTALTADAYDSLRDAIEAARDAVAEDDTIGRLLAVSRAFRNWALANRPEFVLAFTTPPPGRGDRPPAAAEPTDRKAQTRLSHHKACNDAGLRFAGVFTRLFAELWTRQPFSTPEPDAIDPTLRAQLEPLTAEIGAALPEGTHLPMPAVAVYLSCWTRLYGIVAMEAFGHQRWALSDSEPLFEAELATLIDQLRPVEGA